MVFRDTTTKVGETALAIQDTNEIVKEITQQWDDTFDDLQLDGEYPIDNPEVQKALEETDKMIQKIERNWDQEMNELVRQNRIPGDKAFVQKTMDETDQAMTKIDKDISLIKKMASEQRLIPGWEATKIGRAVTGSYDAIIELEQKLKESRNQYKYMDADNTKRYAMEHIRHLERDLAYYKRTYRMNYLASLPLRFILSKKVVNPFLTQLVDSSDPQVQIKINTRTGVVSSATFSVTIPKATQLIVNYSQTLFAVVDVYGEAHIFNNKGQKLSTIAKEYIYLTTISKNKYRYSGFLLKLSDDAVFTVNPSGQIFRHDLGQKPLLIAESLNPIDEIRVSKDGMRVSVYYKVRTDDWHVITKHDVLNGVYHAGKPIMEALYTDNEFTGPEVNFKSGPIHQGNKMLLDVAQGEFSKILGFQPTTQNLDQLRLTLLKALQEKARDPRVNLDAEDRFTILYTRKASGIQYAKTNLLNLFTAKEIQEIATRAASQTP